MDERQDRPGVRFEHGSLTYQACALPTDLILEDPHVTVMTYTFEEVMTKMLIPWIASQISDFPVNEVIKSA